MTLVALPLALGISSLAKPIMASLYQERYPESWIVLAIVPWILLLRFLMEIPAVLLTAINRQLDRFYVVLTASIISIVLTLILVPRLGFKACAITTVVVNVYMLTALWYSAYRAGFKLVPDGKTLRIYVAGGVMFGALCFVSRFGLPLQVLTGAVVYVTAVVLLGVLDREEIRRLTTLLSRLK